MSGSSKSGSDSSGSSSGSSDSEDEMQQQKLPCPEEQQGGRKHRRNSSASSRGQKSDPDLKEKRRRGRDKSRSKSPSPKRSRKEKSDFPDKPNETEKAVPEKSKEPESLTTRTGGAYIPPAKLRLMQQSITDKSSVAFQRLAWEALKKSINGYINKVNSPNIAVIVRELFKENVIRGRGLLCQSIMQAQTASPTFTHVYAGLVSIINSKFPNIGELLLKRLIVNFKRGFKRNDKTKCMSSTRFIAHLINQQVAHEVLALEILTLLLERPSDDSVEVTISFLKECGQKLTEVSPRGIHAIFDRLRNVLHEANLDKRTQYMIEVMFQVRKDGFKDNPSVLEELDLVEEDEQITHMLTLDDATTGDDVLNVFKHDPDFEANEAKYESVKKQLLGEDDSDGESDGSSDSSDEESGSGSDEEDSEKEDTSAPIIDQTETNLIALRRIIYLTIQSSLDFEECVHKLMKMNLKAGHETELCHMVIDCCAQQRTYEKFYGLMAQRLCQLNRSYIEPFQKIFIDSYSTVHRLEIGKLRNVAKIFAHLLFTDAISWLVLSAIKLNENDTTSSSRIFIKLLFQELVEYMGMVKLLNRIRDATLQEAFDGLFPRDDPVNTRFSINYFTAIGLGALTEDLRGHLKSNPKPAAQLAIKSSSSSSDSSSDSSSSSSSDSEDERKKRKKKKDKKQKKKKSKKEKKLRSKKVSNQPDESEEDIKARENSPSDRHRARDDSRRRRGDADDERRRRDDGQRHREDSQENDRHRRRNNDDRIRTERNSGNGRRDRNDRPDVNERQLDRKVRESPEVDERQRKGRDDKNRDVDEKRRNKDRKKDRDESPEVDDRGGNKRNERRREREDSPDRELNNRSDRGKRDRDQSPINENRRGNKQERRKREETPEDDDRSRKSRDDKRRGRDESPEVAVKQRKNREDRKKNRDDSPEVEDKRGNRRDDRKERDRRREKEKSPEEEGNSESGAEDAKGSKRDRDQSPHTAMYGYSRKDRERGRDRENSEESNDGHNRKESGNRNGRDDDKRRKEVDYREIDSIRRKERDEFEKKSRGRNDRESESNGRKTRDDSRDRDDDQKIRKDRHRRNPSPDNRTERDVSPEDRRDRHRNRR